MKDAEFLSQAGLAMGRYILQAIRTKIMGTILLFILIILIVRQESLIQLREHQENSVMMARYGIVILLGTAEDSGNAGRIEDLGKMEILLLVFGLMDEFENEQAVG
ncbi:hypothetical protein CCP4SC76_230001 [Gammaproteobacteria bacterium]